MRKAYSMALVVTAIASLNLFAQEVAPAAISLRVKRMGASKETAKNWQTSYGSYDKDVTQTLSVDVQIDNLRDIATDLTVEWYFIANPVSGSSRWVFDKGAEPIKLGAKSRYKDVKVSADLSASVAKYAALGIKDESGGKMEGYIIRVLQGEKVVQVDATNASLKAIGAKTELLNKLIPPEE